MRRLIVIGNGMAGARLVEEVVRRDGGFAVRLIGAERLGGYNRIGLPDVLAGRRGADALLLNSLGWYEANGVAFTPGVAAVAIDPAFRTVATADGRVHAYDELVIATGSRTAFPAVDGLSLPGVFGL